MVWRPPQRERGAPRRFAASGGLLLVAVVVFGFCVNTAVRMPCRDVCGLDIGRMYDDHHVDNTHLPYVSSNLEYPPLIGEVMAAAHAPFQHGLRNPFLANMVLLTALAAITTWMLWRRNGKRTWRWALAPPVLVQGLQNWDLLAVAPATIGLISWENGFALSAGLLLGIGAAAKLFPALFVPILAASSLGWGRTRNAARLLVGAAVGFAVFVVPVYAAAPRALSYFFGFQSTRVPDRGTVWYFLFRAPKSMQPYLSADLLSHFSSAGFTLLLGAALVTLSWLAWRGRISPFGACALVTIVCLVTSKIYSPQYDLWIVPFFVLLPVRTKLVVNFYIASFAVFVTTAGDDHLIHRPGSSYLLCVAVLYRFVVYLLVARDIVRSEASGSGRNDDRDPRARKVPCAG